MGFDTGVSDGVIKMRAATILGYIVRLYQCTKNPLNHSLKNSKHGHIVAITDSATQ